MDSTDDIRAFENPGGPIEGLLPPDPEVKGIIFDYGGTLDSRGDHWSHIILDAYRSAGLDIGIEDFKRAYIHGERALAVKGAVIPTDNFLDVMRKKVSAELSVAGVAADSAAAEHIARYCYDYARGCIDGVRPLLRELSERLPLVLVSNFYGNINSVLEDFGIRDCFRAVIESAAVGVRKPDPEIFRLGLEALGLEAPEVLVVGDSIDKDIIPARTLGCRTYHIPGRRWPPV